MENTMNQSKKKDRKEEISQPSIRSFVTSTDPNRTIGKGSPSDSLKSIPTKRKIPPSPSSIEKVQDNKKKRPYNTS